MADHEDAQDYTANGPTDIGFRTGGNGTGIANGVVASGTNIGVHGIGEGVSNSNAETWGVFGESKLGIGVQGQSGGGESGVVGFSHAGRGVQGEGNPGVEGTSDSDDGIVGVSSGERKSGVFGDHRPSTGVAFGVSGRCQSAAGAGVNGFSDSANGVIGTSTANDGVVGVSGGERKSGVFGDHTQSTGVAFGVSGRCQSPVGAGVNGFSVSGNGVIGTSTSNDGVVGISSVEIKSGVFGDNTNLTGTAFGVSGRSQSPLGAGVNGFSVSGIGVKGTSTSNHGVVGLSSVGHKSGVFGHNTQPTDAAFGVSGISDSADGAGVGGSSESGYGGQFHGARAPLRLLPAATSGSPTTGEHQIGELFIDGNGDLFLCKGNGTPGTWFLVQLSPA